MDNTFLLVLIRLLFSILTGYVAHRYYERSGIGWSALSLVFEPGVALIFLFVAGKPRLPESLGEPQIPFPYQRLDEPTTLAEHDATCPSCGAVIDLFTGRGLADEGEGTGDFWVPRCAACHTDLPVGLLEETLRRRSVA